jgi:hypothetical protein
MTDRRRSQVARVAVTVLLFGAALLGSPTHAEAQARGTLQVTAQVVDTKASFDGLQAARSALRQVAAGTQTTNVETVPTLAQVSVSRPSQERSELVVTVDYAKN